MRNRRTSAQATFEEKLEGIVGLCARVSEILDNLSQLLQRRGIVVVVVVTFDSEIENKPASIYKHLFERVNSKLSAFQATSIYFSAQSVP